MNIPTWDSAEAACEAGKGTPLDHFIYDYTPAGPDEEVFNRHLQAVVDWLLAKESKQ